MYCASSSTRTCRAGRQAFDVLGQQRVGGQDQVEVGQVLEMRGRRRTQELRREVRRFVEPVGIRLVGITTMHGRSRRPAFFGENMRQGLQGFTQAHVVRKNPADLQLTQRLHPAQAFELVGRNVAFKPFGAVAKSLMSRRRWAKCGFARRLPIAGQVFQRIQARGVGFAQAQGGFAGSCR
jgi:hypothetical protein